MGRLVPVLLIIFVLLFVQLGSGSCRVLQSEEEKLMKKFKNVRLQALPKGDVPPSGPSGCTYIPGMDGHCVIGAKHFAGSALPHSTAHPRKNMVSLDVATNHN